MDRAREVLLDLEAVFIVARDMGGLNVSRSAYFDTDCPV